MNIRNKLKNSIKKINFADRFLILFVIMLYLYVTITLFNQNVPQSANSIDVIIRTALSAVFGYLISKNFSASTSDYQDDVFSSGISSNEILDNISPPESTSQPKQSCSKIQITLVAIIGFTSLLLLLILKNTSILISEHAAEISQLRDFVSGSIGFLISCGKTE